MIRQLDNRTTITISMTNRSAMRLTCPTIVSKIKKKNGMQTEYCDHTFGQLIWEIESKSETIGSTNTVPVQIMPLYYTTQLPRGKLPFLEDKHHKPLCKSLGNYCVHLFLGVPPRIPLKHMASFTRGASRNVERLTHATARWWTYYILFLLAQRMCEHTVSP